MKTTHILLLTIMTAVYAMAADAARAEAARPDKSYPPAIEGAKVETYKQVNGTDLKVWIFYPPNAPQGGEKRGLPAIVFFFGGGWQGGSPKQFEPQSRHLASRGMIAIVADYRVATRQRVKPAECVADAKSCVRWLRENAGRLGIDPQRLAAGGGSAGGHLAAAVATLPGLDEPGEDASDSCVPDALVLFNPGLMMAPFGSVEMKGFGANLTPERFGCAPEAISPIHHVRKGLPPTLILHGRADTTVPYVTVEAFCAEMKKAGNRCELAGYDGMPHGFFNKTKYDETLAEADRFLTSLGYLPKKVLPNILFILTEDNSTQLSFNNTPGIQTPHIDALASAGVYFNNAFVAYPVCSASKACIYTSLHNHLSGILNNTPNYHKPADKLTEAERNSALYRRNRIRAEIPTLIERLREAGYYQGVTHKLHVAPVEKFPYDEFIQGQDGKAAAGFISRASKTGKPWHLFYNVSVSHRPFPDSDTVKIRVKPGEVTPPAFLPDTPVVRQDWAEYLAAIERADALVGEGLEALRASGQEPNTIVVYMGDHGPCYPHGKMTPYDLGLRVPLVLRVPWLKGGFRSDVLASELDLAPTLLDLLGLDPLPKSHGVTLKPVLEQAAGAKGQAFIFAEISHKGNLPNDGMQERSVCDGRWHLIYRERTDPPWRQVQADSKEWPMWGNRTYAETVRVKDRFPDAYRVLQGLDPQNLGGQVPAVELYDLQADPDELRDRAADPACSAARERLMTALRRWVRDTEDPAVRP